MWVLLVFVVLVAALVPAWAETRRALPDWREAPGQRLTLSQGRTHARWIGPVRGPVAVLIHGLTTPSPVWEAVAAGIGSLGYRVLVYDLYGRGYSDNAAGTQDAGFFVRQLEDLLDDQGLEGDLTLVGYSMGGSIATAFAESHPEKVQRLVLVAPCGVAVTEAPVERFMRQVPVLGDWLARVVEPVRMRRAIAAAEAAGSEVPGIFDVQRAQIRRRGFLPAVLSSRRGLLMERQEEAHRKLGREDVPVLAIWAERDALIPLSGLGTLAQWNRNARQEVVAGAGHGLPHTHATQVIEILRGLLREG